MREIGIGELSRRTGVSASALRYYEAQGVLPAPRRAGNRRRYGEDAVRAVEVLRFAQQAGFTLKEIRALFAGFGAATSLGAAWRVLAERKLRELDELQRRVMRMRAALRTGLRCGCLTAADCALVPPAGAAGPASRRAPRAAR